LLKQKSLTLPPSLTESERRLFLDLPTEETETANIRAAPNYNGAKDIIDTKWTCVESDVTGRQLYVPISHFCTSADLLWQITPHVYICPSSP
jgi:hypothetical protein